MAPDPLDFCPTEFDVEKHIPGPEKYLENIMASIPDSFFAVPTEEELNVSNRGRVDIYKDVDAQENLLSIGELHEHIEKTLATIPQKYFEPPMINLDDNVPDLDSKEFGDFLDKNIASAFDLIPDKYFEVPQIEPDSDIPDEPLELDAPALAPPAGETPSAPAPTAGEETPSV